MRPKIASSVLSIAMAGTLVLAACGGDDDDTQASDTTESDAGSATTAADAAAGPITTAMTDLGEVLVDADGMTLYVFTNDTEGVSTCTDACADTWPAATTDSDQLPEGLDPAIFSVSEAPDGSFQLAANDQPLYTFSGDAAAGDTNGQGIGGIWFVVGADGNMIQDAAAGSGGAGGGGATTTTAPPATDDDDGGGYDY